MWTPFGTNSFRTLYLQNSNCILNWILLNTNWSSFSRVIYYDQSVALVLCYVPALCGRAPSVCRLMLSVVSLMKRLIGVLCRLSVCCELLSFMCFKGPAMDGYGQLAWVKLIQKEPKNLLPFATNSVQTFRTDDTISSEHQKERILFFGGGLRAAGVYFKKKQIFHGNDSNITYKCQTQKKKYPGKETQTQARLLIYSHRL